MKSIICEKSEAIGRAAEQVRLALEEKNNLVLGMAVGKSTEGLMKKLAELCQDGKLSFKAASIFLVADFEGAPQGLSCRERLDEWLISQIDILPENCFYISSENCADYDAMIKEKGGMDLIVLGLGANAHIGFNEPACPFSCVSHRQRITDATKRQNAGLFGGFENVPGIGWTMGIKTIYEAKSFMVLAFGEEKAEPVFKMLYGRNDSRFPAAFLQVPSDVSCYMDPDAASKL